jgi:epoxyqueuosine reductase
VRGQSLKSKVHEMLNHEGISLVGVADATALTSKYNEFSPRALLSGARSVIIFAIPIPRGVTSTPDNNLLQYWRFCNMTYRKLDMAANLVCNFIEDEGANAAPAYSCWPQRSVNREFFGLLPLVEWAAEAGLGQVSRCGLLVTQRYGTRLLLCGVVTDALLKADKKLAGEICPSGCNICAEICPAGAIGGNGKVDHALCTRYANPNPLFQMLIRDEYMKKHHSFDVLLNTGGVDDHATYSCAGCMQACKLNNQRDTL